MNIKNIFRIFHQNTKEYTFSLACHGAFSNIDLIVRYKANYNIRENAKHFLCIHSHLNTQITQRLIKERKYPLINGDAKLLNKMFAKCIQEEIKNIIHR